MTETQAVTLLAKMATVLVARGNLSTESAVVIAEKILKMSATAIRRDATSTHPLVSQQRLPDDDDAAWLLSFAYDMECRRYSFFPTHVGADDIARLRRIARGKVETASEKYNREQEHKP